VSNWSANEIVSLLEAPAEDRSLVRLRILEEAPGDRVIESLRLARLADTCQILCDILGERCEAAAVPVLIDYLEHPAPPVRAAAADGLGKIGDSRAGPALYRRFTDREEDAGVKHMLAAALGATGHRPAIGRLILALEDADPVLRRTAAWSLGILGAAGAEEALRRSLCLCLDPHNAMVIVQAWVAVRLVSRATSASNGEAGLPVLSAALWDPSTCPAAAWALSTLASPRAATALRRVLKRRQKYPCFVRRRIEDALQTLEAPSEG
jgi:HEAT repeat protein